MCVYTRVHTILRDSNFFLRFDIAEGWGNSNSQVMCRQLGCLGTKLPRVVVRFGGGDGPIWMDGVICAGSEGALSDCTSQAWDSHIDCTHADDVGVCCQICPAGSGCGLGLSVEQDLDTFSGEGLALSWKIPPTGSPISMVQIFITASSSLDYHAWSQPDHYYQLSQVNEICTKFGHFLACTFYVPLLALPAGPEVDNYLVTLRLTSYRTGATYVADEYVDVIGVPSEVQGIECMSQTQTAWSLKWSPPEYFFRDLDPVHNHYVLDLSCGSDHRQIQYSNAVALRQKTFVAQLDVKWYESGWNGSESSSMVKIGADNMGLIHTNTLMCVKGSNVSITVIARNKFFEGDVSHPVLLQAITVPSRPTIDAIDEILNGGGLRVMWFQVRKTMLFAHVVCLCVRYSALSEIQ